MARKCQITGKSSLSGNNRSHAMNATKRKWKVNTQTIKMNVDGRICKVTIAARTLRTLRRKGLIIE